MGVAPFAGAWIEIMIKQRKSINLTMSLPSRERGLKLRCTPTMNTCADRRSLRGSVD